MNSLQEKLERKKCHHSCGHYKYYLNESPYLLVSPGRGILSITLLLCPLLTILRPSSLWDVNFRLGGNYLLGDNLCVTCVPGLVPWVEEASSEVQGWKHPHIGKLFHLVLKSLSGHNYVRYCI